MLHLADALGHQGRIAQHADPDRAVDAFADQVDEAIARADAHVQHRVQLQEFGQARNELAARQLLRHVDPDGARAGAGEQAIHVVQLAQKAGAALQVNSALDRQADLARGALEQPRAQVLLDAVDRIGDRRAWQAELFRSLRKALALRDSLENLHRLDLVHCFNSSNN